MGDTGGKFAKKSFLGFGEYPFFRLRNFFLHSSSVRLGISIFFQTIRLLKKMKKYFSDYSAFGVATVLHLLSELLNLRFLPLCICEDRLDLELLGKFWTVKTYKLWFWISTKFLFIFLFPLLWNLSFRIFLRLAISGFFLFYKFSHRGLIFVF